MAKRHADGQGLWRRPQPCITQEGRGAGTGLRACRQGRAGSQICWEQTLRVQCCWLQGPCHWAAPPTWTFLLVRKLRPGEEVWLAQDPTATGCRVRGPPLWEQHPFCSRGLTRNERLLWRDFTSALQLWREKQGRWESLAPQLCPDQTCPFVPPPRPTGGPWVERLE